MNQYVVDYLNNQKSRFRIADVSGVVGKPFQIVDRKTSKHYYFAKKDDRDAELIKLLVNTVE